ncbi:SafA/ExsA family spore coat assembly protein [Neobacillus massiliamazoniensis]|uniref:SCP-like extracellular protein n=1 Tax=Neobacillus massiliamazoniensis TaxID=1499688 RepID=A0A0U1NV68_9BACI|nr:SafA/ExsA family spore coat assembly protein [Neobacillus massiliamazoniensis]CRK81927.1 SCP-like extracellular protein [Neobacillus massiliamazoniensis]
MKKTFWIGLLFILSLFCIPNVSFAQQVYIVQPGDSLWKIAVRYQVGLSELIGANPQFKNPHLIYPGQKVNIPNLDATKSIENQVIQLTNQQRAKFGLKPLTMDWQLSRVARYKAMDMRDNNYFSHTSPTYGDPFTMMRNFGIVYSAAAENIAAGQITPAEVVQAWMNSSGHRANILNANYTYIGCGYAKGGSQGYYWVQQFISK